MSGPAPALVRALLPGGLSLVVDENHAAPVAALQVWVRAGAADEQADEHGIAHLHEHMLFKGTARRGPGEIARAIEAAGGEINAWTSFDHTVYHCVVASRFWRTGLDVLADAVTSAAFDPEELAREIEVVCEEIKRALDSPGRKVSRELFSAAFATHPYGRPVIGTEESVRALTREKILRFYRRWYQPHNLTVVAVGDLDAQEVRAEAERLFRWPAQPGVPALEAPPSMLPAPRRPQEPERARPVARVLEAPLREGLVSLAWPAPHQRHPDVPALDALALVLAHGESSRLRRALKRDRLLCNDVSASAYTPRDPGLNVVTLALQPAQARAAAEEALRQVHRLRFEEVTDEELEGACRVLEADAVYQRETVQGQARKLGFWEAGGGGAEAEQEYFERVARLSPAELRAAAQRHLDPRQVVLAAVLPPEAREQHGVDQGALRALLDEAAQEAAHTLPPPPRGSLLPRRAVPRVSGDGSTGPLLRSPLPGGGTLLVKVERAVPLLAVRAAWGGGLRAETEALGGAHLLLARLVSKGTRARGAEALARTAERIGGALGGAAGRNSFGLRLEALARHRDEALALFAEALCEPGFAPAEVERERALQREELRARDDSPGSVAFRLFESTLWRAHPYRLDVLGSARSLDRLDAGALEALRGRLYVPAGATLSVVGDVDPEAVRALFERELAPSAAAALGAPRPAPPQEPLPERPRAALRALPKAQAQLVVGFPGASLTDPGRHALELLASILSGQGGRLFVELRDRQSLAYSVGAFSMEGVDPGAFAVHLACGPEKIGAALAGIRGELERCRGAPPAEAELEKARAHLAGVQAIGLQRNSARAALFALDECYGLGAEHGLRYAERLAAVSAADVQRAALRFLDPRREMVALVAPEGAAPPELAEAAARTQEELLQGREETRE